MKTSNHSIVTLSSEDITILSIDSLHTRDMDDALDDSAGIFRWTDVTKFADGKPAKLTRKKSFDASRDEHRDAPLRPFVRRGKRPKPIGSKRPVFVTTPSYMSPKPPCRSVSNSHDQNEQQQHLQSTPTTLGQRISLLVSSPTNSPRSTIAGPYQHPPLPLSDDDDVEEENIKRYNNRSRNSHNRNSSGGAKQMVVEIGVDDVLSLGDVYEYNEYEIEYDSDPYDSSDEFMTDSMKEMHISMRQLSISCQQQNQQRRRRGRRQQGSVE